MESPKIFAKFPAAKGQKNQIFALFITYSFLLK
jgi:hypothetical protein